MIVKTVTVIHDSLVRDILFHNKIYILKKTFSVFSVFANPWRFAEIVRNTQSFDLFSLDLKLSFLIT